MTCQVSVGRRPSGRQGGSTAGRRRRGQGSWTVIAAAGLNWRVAEHWSLVLAYRGLGVNPSGAVDRAILHGPLLGLGLRF